MVRKMNKRGWLKIIEASIAILLIAISFMIISSRQKTVKGNSEIIDLEAAILEGIANDEDMRNDIISYPMGSIPPKTEEVEVDNVKFPRVYNFIDLRVPDTLRFQAKVCNISKVCAYTPAGMGSGVPNPMYVRERVISASLTSYDPRNIKIFIWKP